MDELAIRTGFWPKVKRLAGKLPFLPDVVALYYCMMDSKTPLWVKVQIGAAVAYFISPIDAVPDVIPFVGYGDDAAVVATTFGLVHRHVTDEHHAKAREFFGR